VPVELSAELPIGPFRVIGRAAHGWSPTTETFGSGPTLITERAEESTALFGIRLGRDHRWGKVVAGLGPYLAITYRDIADTKLEGLELGVDLFAGD
jgi:hypothetical protein